MKRFLIVALALLLGAPAFGQGQVTGTGTGGTAQNRYYWAGGANGPYAEMAMNLGVYNSTLPMLASGAMGTLQLSTRGELLVNLSSGGTSAGIGAPADALVNTVNGLATRDLGHVFNGTTWDRNRSASSAQGTTGTGVPAAGIMGFDGTNFRRILTDTSGRPVAMQYANAASTSLAASATLGDTNILDAGPSPSGFSRCTGQFYSAQTGTYLLQVSPDGSSLWFTVATGAVTAGATMITSSVNLAFRYCRAYILNGGTISTLAHVGASLSAN